MDSETNPSPSTSRLTPSSTDAPCAGTQAREQKRPLRSEQLVSALKSLESAFAAWESLGDQTPVEAKTNSSSDTENETKFKETRQLFHQLRAQLEKL
jgi:hypothetical protein